jgi:hypothetical protein
VNVTGARRPNPPQPQRWTVAVVDGPAELQRWTVAVVRTTGLDHCCSWPRTEHDSVGPLLSLARRAVGCHRLESGLSDAAAMLSAMKHISPAADRAVLDILRRQGDLITREQVLGAGWSEGTLRHRTRTDGPWGIVLPGVYLSHSGSLTGVQREIAAVLYVGRGCVITGQAALHRRGVPVPPADVIDVLIPDSARRQSADFVRVHRTSRMPERPWVSDGIRWAPVSRAVADVARGGLAMREVRAVVATVVQRRTCTIQQLAIELNHGPVRGSGALRAALEEVSDGIASGAEGDMRKLIKTGRLPEPMYNPSLFVGQEFLAQPDLWWRDAGVAGEVDSREWHLSPEQWKRTMARHSAMSAHGIIVLHFTPAQVRTEGAKVIAELRSAIEAGLRRPPLPIRTVPHR